MLCLTCPVIIDGLSSSLNILFLLLKYSTDTYCILLFCGLIDVTLFPFIRYLPRNLKRRGVFVAIAAAAISHEMYHKVIRRYSRAALVNCVVLLEIFIC